MFFVYRSNKMINDKNLDDNRDSGDKIHGYQGIFKIYREILIHTKGWYVSQRDF